ncbi:MAG: ABC transporter substrate-binding protein [Armatimonadota bacterium]|nr:ABC transporter substrate-binding protein [Armatimonadota bacterium]
MMRWQVIAVVMSVAVVLLAVSPGTHVSSGAAEPLTIGAAAPLTGPRALLGRNYRQGVELAVGEINESGGVLGRPLRVVFEDDQGDNPLAAINAVSRLINVHRVPLMLGPHYSVAQLATQKTYCQAKVISITGASGVPVTAQGCPYVFRVRASDAIVAPALARYVKENLKFTKVAILYVNDDFGRAGAEAATKALAAVGLKPIAVEVINAGDKDFTAVLSKMVREGAESVITWIHDIEAGLVLRQARELNLKLRFAGTTSLSEPSFIALAGDAAEGVISANDFVPTVPTDRVRAFVKRYTVRYKMLPEIWASAYYDATWLAAKVIESAKGTDPDKVREAFLKLRYSGVLADYRFDPNGDGNHQIHIVEVRKGMAEWVATVKF